MTLSHSLGIAELWVKKGTENMLRVMGLCACLESEAAALRQKKLLAFLGFCAPVSDYTLK